MDHRVRILHTGFVTHDVRQYIVSRPDAFTFDPGQGVELAFDENGWREEGRPFTPTSLPSAPVLEFTIKGYLDHDGVTRKLNGTGPGTELLMSDPFGTITYQGPGTFVAGGAGVTPFLSILRSIEDEGELEQCSLLFSNRTPADVICEKELRALLGDRCHLTCTERSAPGYGARRIDRAYLEEKVEGIDQPFYLCGPPAFVDDLSEALEAMGATPDRIVVEE
jgi:ferredoxin-NADP reductase